MYNIEKIFDPSIKFRIKHSRYENPPQLTYWGWVGVYRFIMNNEVILTFPNDFIGDSALDTRRITDSNASCLFTSLKMSHKSLNIIEYIISVYYNTPRENLLTLEIDQDRWGILDILRAADKRLGFRRLYMHALCISDNSAARKLLKERFKSKLS